MLWLWIVVLCVSDVAGVRHERDTTVPKLDSASIRHGKSRLSTWLWTSRDRYIPDVSFDDDNVTQDVTVAQVYVDDQTKLLNDVTYFNDAPKDVTLINGNELPYSSNILNLTLVPSITNVTSDKATDAQFDESNRHAINQDVDVENQEPKDLTDQELGHEADQMDVLDADLGSIVVFPLNENTPDVTRMLSRDDGTRAIQQREPHVDVVTHFLRIVESQHLLGDNCTAGTDLKLGEGVVDRYAQEKFRLEADLAVNRANMLTRLWKYADADVMRSEYLLHASVFSMVEFDDDIFAAGNCYDEYQYKDYGLFCPFAYRLPEGPILVKDLAVGYKYLSNTSEFFYIARKNAQRVINNHSQISRGYHLYPFNDSTHGERMSDEILAVHYEDGKWSQPYYDCGGGNIWMLTYTVPFFGYANGSYFFKGTSGIDIDLRRVDIDQCPSANKTHLNIFAASDKCKKRTTKCVAIAGFGFRRGSYKCECKRGYYFPVVNATPRYYNGTIIEEEYEKLLLGLDSEYSKSGVFECLTCSEGCDHCSDDRPCVVTLNWIMRSVLLLLTGIIICCLPLLVAFTSKYGHVKVVRAASPVLLRVITLGAFFIYCTFLIMYPTPSVYTCTARVWLREIGFSLTYGALMLKTWRISVIFHIRSAKAVKITDMNLLKRLGVIVGIFCSLLTIRTLVAPPQVIVGRTSDDLKAYLCTNNWWDHMFTTMEVAFLVWGIRLCVVVRKTPSEFNEAKFISMAIYNEFLLSLFLNISMFFLQSPANPDLQYIVLFCHTQLTITLLLCLIFGSKVYIVFKDKSKDIDYVTKPPQSKFVIKPKSAAASPNVSFADIDSAKTIEQHFHDEYERIYAQLCKLRERHVTLGNGALVAKITDMQLATLKCLVVTNDLHRANTPEPPGYRDAIYEDAVKVKSFPAPFTATVQPCQHNERTFATNERAFAANERVVGERAFAFGTLDRSLSALNGLNAATNAATTNLAHALSTSLNVTSRTSSLRNRSLKSGHAHTHSIVINLDDKTKFTEEITV